MNGKKAPPARQVIVRHGGIEIHGYAVGFDGKTATVVWEVASGRRRQRDFPAEDIFIPSPAMPWAGQAIRQTQLHAPRRRTRAA